MVDSSSNALIICNDKFLLKIYLKVRHYKILLHNITYLNGHYNPSVRIIDLVSHTIYVVCVNFIHKWRDLQFTVDSERQIFLRNFSWQFLFDSQSFCRKSAERKSPKKYFFRISFWCLAWDSNPGFSSNNTLPTRPRRPLFRFRFSW